MYIKQLIPLTAILLLLLGSISSIYVYANQNEEKELLINGQSYHIDQIFDTTKKKTINSLNVTGIALDELIMKTDMNCPSCYKYTIIGKDGYRKTVSWDSMQNGIITNEKKVVFSDLPKAFQVKDVVRIEAI